MTHFIDSCSAASYCFSRFRAEGTFGDRLAPQLAEFVESDGRLEGPRTSGPGKASPASGPRGRADQYRYEEETRPPTERLGMDDLRCGMISLISLTDSTETGQ